MRKLLILLILFVSAGAIASASTFVPWTGSGSFDDEEIFFPGFTADTFLGITSGGGILHDHGAAPTTFSLDIFLNGAWVNLATFGTAPDDTDYFLADVFTGPVAFSSGTVSGLRLTADPDVLQAYHSLNDVESIFEFDSLNAVPEPSSIGLMGLGLIGLGWYRRRQAKRAA